MSVSPFTFYRGAAGIMAADLKDTPTAGLNVQLCGDAHLSNFGAFASPERTLLFDLNDFDETLPGPFEYDVKRMAASFTIAGRNNGFSAVDVTAATLASVRAYREAMIEFSGMGNMEIWYARLTEQDLMDAISTMTKGAGTKQAATQARKGAERAKKAALKAHTRDSLQALSKLAEVVDGHYQIVSQPPVVIPARDLEPMYGYSAEQLQEVVHQQFRALPRDVAGGSAPAPRAIRDRRHGPQSGGCRQRRHKGIHRPAPGPRPTRPVVSPSEGGDAPPSSKATFPRADSKSQESG